MIAANPPVETRKDSRFPKVRYWNGSQSRRTDGHWLSAQCTWEGNSLRVRVCVREDGKCVDGGINWPNERPTAARRLMIVKLGKHNRTEFIITEFYMPSTISSWVHGFMDSWMMDPRDGLLLCGGVNP